MEDNNYIVCVKCPTYNQVSYIEDAMNGFCIQETTFPFVCMIIDDASTDGEPEVIRKYLQEHFDLEDKTIARDEETDDYVLTFARHKTNQNCFFAVLYLKYNHYSIKKSKASYMAELNNNAKYIAFCEGDDYWVASDKLQRQIQFMEKQTDCVMTISNGIGLDTISGEKKKLNPIPINSSRYLTMPEILIEKGCLIPTASMCLRSQLYFSRPQNFKNPYVGDRPLRMWCAVNGKLYYDIEPLVVYRQGSIGSFGCRTAKDPIYARNVMVSMCDFFDFFDNYTHYNYHSEVLYMKERECYSFYIKTNNLYKILSNKFYLQLSFQKRKDVFIRLLKNNIKILLGLNQK